MPGDRYRPSIFDRIQEGEEKNVPLLLDIIYGDLLNKVGILEAQMKGRLGNHEAEIARADSRVKKLENCPCAVHRDPAHTCVILDVRDELAAIRAENARELAVIRTRLAWWGGGLAVVIFLLELSARLLPLLWR